MLRATLLSLALLSTPALANHYRAQTAQAPAAAKFVVKDMLWKCSEAECFAPKSNSRPAIVCSALVKEVGALTSFSVGGQPLPAEQLEKCNARAAQ